MEYEPTPRTYHPNKYALTHADLRRIKKRKKFGMGGKKRQRDRVLGIRRVNHDELDKEIMGET